MSEFEDIRNANRELRAKTLKSGWRNEKRFRAFCEKTNRHWMKCTNDEDRFDKLDCRVNGYGVNVKTIKSLSSIWVEIWNSYDKPSTFLGEAKYIVYYVTDINHFFVFYREELLDFCIQYLNYDIVYTKQNHRPYRRSIYNKETGERKTYKGIVIGVCYEDVSHLWHKKYNLHDLC